MLPVLGIDMGGTATRWVLLTDGGSVSARGSGPGANGHLFNQEARGAFASVLAAMAQDVGGPVAAIHAGISGLGPSVHEEAASLLSRYFGCSPPAISLCDDMELAYRAAFAPGEGHLVSAGTGTIGLHIAADGASVRVGGRGILIDDAGSGSWIALTALDRLYRRIDETGGPAEALILAEELFAAMGGSRWDDTRAFIYRGDRGRIGALARAVAAAEQRGDPLAAELIADAASELARLGQALVRRVGRHPIGYVGRILDLTPSLKPLLAEALSGFDLVFPHIDAALSAAKLAHERVRAN